MGRKSGFLGFRVKGLGLRAWGGGGGGGIVSFRAFGGRSVGISGSGILLHPLGPFFVSFVGFCLFCQGSSVRFLGAFRVQGFVVLGFLN